MHRMFSRGVLQRASTPFGAVTVAARRRVCDSAKPLAAQVHQALAQVKAIEMKLDHLEKDEVTDLLLGFVKRGEIAPRRRKLCVRHWQGREPPCPLEVLKSSSPHSRLLTRRGISGSNQYPRTVLEAVC